MSANAYALLGLTAMVAALVSVLVFAVLKFGAAAREAKKGLNTSHAESLLLTAALEDAFATLKAQERATAARADASERLSGQIVASLTSGLVVVDATHAVKIINPAARRILGIPEGDLSLEHVPSLTAVIRECLDGNTPVLRREITATRGADTLHLGVTVSPLHGDGSDAGGAICLFSDLTGVVALEEQLRFKEALAQVGELTAGLAHEFRNGLATIHGYGRLLNPDALPHPQREYIVGIRSETQALSEVVTNFLKFARPEPLVSVPMPLRTIVERAAEDTPAADVSIAGDFGVVSADDVLLRQAFSNLFRNCVDACTAAGRQAVVEVDGRRDARNQVVVTVRDHGPGIPADAIEKVFQPFFTTRPTGTGLGLAIVQKVIVSHNGRVTAANHPDGGAVFTVTFPAVAGESVSA